MAKVERKIILAVDDDEDVLFYLNLWLRDHGFEVDVAHNGKEAWEKLKANRPDLITLDIVMPDKTGVKFYREVRKDPEYSCIPVIVITGLDEEFRRFISHRKSAPPPDGYISKPFDREELLHTIRKILSKKGEKVIGGRDEIHHVH